MGMVVKQKIEQKKLTFTKLLGILFLAIIALNLMVRIFSSISPRLGSIGGMIAFILTAGGCVSVIYKQVAYYNYQLMDNDLMLERVIGRANHSFVSVKVGELEFFKPYRELKEQEKSQYVKQYKFVSGRNEEFWYVGQFTQSGDRYRFIIEPNRELIEAIQRFNAEE